MQKFLINGIIIPCNPLAVAGLPDNGMLKHSRLQFFFIITFRKIVFILITFFFLLL